MNIYLQKIAEAKKENNKKVLFSAPKDKPKKPIDESHLEANRDTHDNMREEADQLIYDQILD